MNAYQNYSIETEIGGWSRIDMLLELYERAISEITVAADANENGNDKLLAEKTIEANRYLLALHGGLNTDKFPLATDVARLLNFVMLRLEEKNFAEAIHFLKKLKNSYAQIRDEANELEKSGKIPPLDGRPGLNTVA